ncbi:interferon-induced GTP-binding protein Mx [Whalleya microplaca]|nr:interferon-induced GTP-binding protein Mx [Whalleya microplaca]
MDKIFSSDIRNNNYYTTPTLRSFHQGVLEMLLSFTNRVYRGVGISITTQIRVKIGNSRLGLKSHRGFFSIRTQNSTEENSPERERPDPPSSPITGGNVGLTLEELQTDEQRRILDVITQVRKCGLESVLSLPQIVVCGSQSAGKSSVLEALTEIPFPRGDNLCTRFATEISLRREAVQSLTIKVIPDNARTPEEQEKVKRFSESITDFGDLPVIMDTAMKVMGVSNSDQTPGSTFAKDTLSIEITGPSRPQLTLVDIPGLIQASTKGVSAADVAMVTEITDHYISQPRTICLAVVSAANDAANQPILERVRMFDPDGERTLGVITKPDRLDAGSDSEAKFLELARNEDVFFKLGWHVIKNRKFEERGFSFEERNSSEMTYFNDSNFKALPKEIIGIDALRVRLSHLLLEHVKNELPRLRKDLKTALRTSKEELTLLGDPRSTAFECREYLARINMDCYEICKAGLQGNYEHEYFKAGAGEPFSLKSKSTIARLRAAVQYINQEFAAKIRLTGHKYHIMSYDSGDEPSADKPSEDEPSKDESSVDEPSEDEPSGDEPYATLVPSATLEPQVLSKTDSIVWVQKMLLRSRGTELIGNFNPHLIADLFWEQSEPWEKLANDHIDQAYRVCKKFLLNLLDQKVSSDVKSRIWASMVAEALNKRRLAASSELAKLLQDNRDLPMNYNHYYTENLQKRNQERMKARLQKKLTSSISIKQPTSGKRRRLEKAKKEVDMSIDRIVAAASNFTTTPDMEKFSCEEALDCLMAIYKVQKKVFIANVTTQVIERHIIRGLDSIFSPLIVVNMPDSKVESIAGEPSETKRQRAFLVDRIHRLEGGAKVFRNIGNGIFAGNGVRSE